MSMKERNHYAGIGSRETPAQTLVAMQQAAAQLETMDFVLNSGGATGADQAFEYGVKDPANKQIFLPWDGFNGRSMTDPGCELTHNWAICDQATDLAQKFHPNWAALSREAKSMMWRNAFQVLGEDLKTPVRFIMCWTEGGKIKGGTGQALRMAAAYKIPVFNLGSMSLAEAAAGVNEIAEQIREENAA